VIHFPPRPHRWKRRWLFRLFLPAVLFPCLAFAGRALTDDPASGPTVVIGGKPAPDNSASTRPAVSSTVDLNELVKQKVASMPVGGSYRANIVAMTALRQSVQLVDSQ
jgi:hypothetical protein